MTLAECTADLKFLTDGEGLLCTNNLQFPYASALASLHRDKVYNLTEVILELAIHQF